MRDNYNFNISLSVLNHLGRNLYRNIVTILGEAISNSWDADAHNVYIFIDKDKKFMSIKDDGIGMTDDDFQDKFLRIGHSKRKDGISQSALNRPFIGRKGIGKLALLSCAKRITVLSKVKDGELVGGIIDNSDLDEAITDDIESQKYILGKFDEQSSRLMSGTENGTLILFESISDEIVNTIEYIRKAIALYYRFSLIDSDFNIFVNNELINEYMIEDFANKTEFLWKINDFSDPFIGIMSKLLECKDIHTDFCIKGYIASAKKPSDTKIRGTQEKVTIDLFVNGRLREKDILRRIPTSRIVENYVYGQIHCDFFDKGNTKDIFTSSREGIISDNHEFNNFLNEFKRIFNKIIEEWDEFRRKHGSDGDPDNSTIPPKARKAQELFNTTFNEMNNDEKFVKKGGIVEKWVQELSREAQFNIPSYTECFISENLLRKYINYIPLPLNKEASRQAAEWQGKEKKSKEDANISYDIRQSQSSEFYLDMNCLANWIDKVNDPKRAGLSRSATLYKPMRDAVGHTSLLTENAKQQLTIVYENIKARLVQILKDFERNQ